MARKRLFLLAAHAVLKNKKHVIVASPTSNLAQPQAINQRRRSCVLQGIETENSTQLKVGYNTMRYQEDEVERIARVAFKLAQQRGRKLCSVDKSNVLEVSQLWREVVTRVAPEYPDVELEHMYVDNAAMQLVRNPKALDTIVTGESYHFIRSLLFYCA